MLWRKHEHLEKYSDYCHIVGSAQSTHPTLEEVGKVGKRLFETRCCILAPQKVKQCRTNRKCYLMYVFYHLIYTYCNWHMNSAYSLAKSIYIISVHFISFVVCIYPWSFVYISLCVIASALKPFIYSCITRCTIKVFESHCSSQ